MYHRLMIWKVLIFQDWSGFVDQNQAGGDQYHVGDFIYVMPAETTGLEIYSAYIGAVM
jgi:hypothetical protein